MSLSSCFACSTWRPCSLRQFGPAFALAFSNCHAFRFILLRVKWNANFLAIFILYSLLSLCLSVCVRFIVHCVHVLYASFIFVVFSASSTSSCSVRIELSSTYAELTKLLLSAASFIADQLTVLHIQYRLYEQRISLWTLWNESKVKPQFSNINHAAYIHASGRCPQSPIPRSHSFFLSVSLSPTRPTYPKGKTQYEYCTYMRYLLYIFCLLGGLRTVNKIFQLGCLLQRSAKDLLCMSVCVGVRKPESL